ncbi:hypothetical protein [Methanoregula sp.]|uniref:hypothetical protein n=1 Tax=Methanoregula sp. TaxID=2052170 RepID=UPI0026041353|nr:hypothetical protein [Methanoregula sp.]MDD5143273.1 hypothetical protein [Methanoregula sp.]
MENTLVVPAAVIGVAFIVFGAALGVMYLSGDSALPPQPPPNLAPLESPVPYAVGDIIQSEDASQVVIVTGYDAYREFYSYQPVVVNASAGTLQILEGTGTMPCQEFEARYPTKVFMST